MGATMATNTPHIAFLSLPGEIRNKIYRILFCDTALSTPGIKRTGQLIRTCKQIYSEGISILYGENAFDVELTNTGGPFYQRTILSPVLCDTMYDRPDRDEQWYNELRERHRDAVLPHLRRFSIKINYTCEHSLELLRKAVRNFVARLKEDDMGGVEFLELDCKLDCRDADASNRRDPAWDSYTADGDEEECVEMLRTWFGRLRGVKYAVIKGLPAEDAEILKGRLQSPAEDGEGDEEMALADMYVALEKHASGLPHCAGSLKKALWAAEEDDVEEFRARKAVIHDRLKRHWERIKNDEKLWQF